jgi:hypothetical protein
VNTGSGIAGAFAAADVPSAASGHGAARIDSRRIDSRRMDTESSCSDTDSIYSFFGDARSESGLSDASRRSGMTANSTADSMRSMHGGSVASSTAIQEAKLAVAISRREGQAKKLEHTQLRNLNRLISRTRREVELGSEVGSEWGGSSVASAVTASTNPTLHDRGTVERTARKPWALPWGRGAVDAGGIRGRAGAEVAAAAADAAAAASGGRSGRMGGLENSISRSSTGSSSTGSSITGSSTGGSSTASSTASTYFRGEDFLQHQQQQQALAQEGSGAAMHSKSPRSPSSPSSRREERERQEQGQQLEAKLQRDREAERVRTEEVSG